LCTTNIGRVFKFMIMEGNYLTSGDLAMWEVRNRNYGYGDCGYGHYGHNRNGMAATGIGLGAGLGGAALIAALVVGWGVNQASKARAKAAEQTGGITDGIERNDRKCGGRADPQHLPEPGRRPERRGTEGEI
jgi:hypothetical protein